MDKSPLGRIVIIAAIVGFTTVAALIVYEVLTNFWAFVAGMGIIGAITTGMCIAAYHWIKGKIEHLKAKGQLSRLMVEEKKVEIEAARHAYLLEYERIKVIRENNSWRDFSASNVLAVRNTVGEIEVRYEPKAIEAISSTREIMEIEESEKIEETIYARDIMDRYGHRVGEKIIIGINGKMGVMAFKWEKLGPILILGIMGGGKTNTAAWIVGQEVAKGAKIVLIDSHASHEESMYRRLNMPNEVYLLPVASTPASASKVANYTMEELEARKRAFDEKGRIVFIIDEFTALMRAGTDKESKWNIAAKNVKRTLEELSTEGRKFNINVVCIGQASNASRSGGTEVRDMFGTVIAHGMRKRQAQNLGLVDEKEDIRELDDGEVFADIQGFKQVFYARVPFLGNASNARIAGNMQYIDARSTRSTSVQDAFIDEVIDVPGTPSGTVVNVPEKPIERLEPIEERVYSLARSGAPRDVVIDELWGAKRGGSKKYQEAKEEYYRILEHLVSLGLLGQKEE